MFYTLIFGPGESNGEVSVGQSSPFVSSIWGERDDTMPLPPAFVTDTNLCLFPKSGRNLPPCASWFGVWVLSSGVEEETMPGAGICIMAILRQATLLV